MIKHQVLFVDDEINILHALERAFIAENEIKVFTACTVQEGIRLLEQETIELVISDEKMPIVQGHQFLSYIKDKFPDTIRIILTGYADVTAILAAVNSGEVYRYLKKPWDNNELVLTVKKALEFHTLKKKNEQMHKIIREQNKQLKLFNLNLESNIQERTVQLKKALLSLKQMHTARKYISQTIDLNIAFISLLNRDLAAHMLRVVNLITPLLDELAITHDEKEKIIHAACLHDVGLLDMPAGFFDKPATFVVTEEQHKIFFNHPAVGQCLVRSIHEMAEAGDIIFAHQENYDGSGFPLNKWGDKIPLGARVIRLASEYDELIAFHKKNSKEALQLLSMDNSRFDPELLPLFVKQIETESRLKSRLGFEATLANLKPDMILQENIYLNNGMLLFTGGKVVDQVVLNKLNVFAPLLNPEKPVRVHYLQAGPGK